MARVGAELHGRPRISRAAGGGDHRRAEGLGQHDRRGADAGRAAMDQQRLAGLQAAALEHIGPDGEEGLGHRAPPRPCESPAGTGSAFALVRRCSIPHSRRRARAPQTRSPSFEARRALAQRRRPRRRSRGRECRRRPAAADRRPARCSTSGRLTPAAATLTRTSPRPGPGRRPCIPAPAPRARPAP